MSNSNQLAMSNEMKRTSYEHEVKGCELNQSIRIQK